jgi:F420-dependent oxidoreductase-like protein
MVHPEFAVDLNYYLDYATLEKFVFEAEGLGYHSFWYMDHLMWQGSRPPWNRQGAVLECWMVLSALASVTEKIRLGSLVVCNSYRNPALLAKMAATLDVISGGRLEFGIGAGWKKDEYEAYGYDFPEGSTRLTQLEEALQIIMKMWTEDKPSFEGDHYTIRDAVCEPKPIQKPHPPIWIGGSGEKVTLKLVAKYADGYNWRATPEDYRKKIHVLKKHFHGVGRDFSSITKSLWSPVIIDRDEENLERKVQKHLLKFREASTEGSVEYVSQSEEEWLDRRIIGTPDKCVIRVNEYVDCGVEFFHLVFEGLEGMKLFSEKVIPEID